MSDHADVKLGSPRLWSDGEVVAVRDDPIPPDVLGAMTRIVSMRASGGPVAEEDVALTGEWIKSQRRKYGHALPISRGRN